MKRLLLLMLGAMTAFASCQKDAGLDGDVSGDGVSVTISATMNNGGAATRATGDGDGALVDRCLLEVYLDGSLYKRMVTAVSGQAASFELTLVSSQEYEFLLWADKANVDTGVTSDVGADVSIGSSYDKHYDTDNGLKAISADYSSYVGSDETRDAFYFYSKQALPDTGVIDAALTRPFAQVNVKTYLDGVDSSQYPKEAKVTYSTQIAKTFDMSEDTTSAADLADYDDLTWSAAAAFVSADTATGTPYYNLSTDYLFAPADAQMLIDFSMDITLENDTVVTNGDFDNIPIQRNYQTNISGELLTKKGTIKVTLSDAFNSSTNEIEIQSVATADDLNTTLTNDANVVSTSYIVTTEVADGTAITIPATTADDATRSITLSEVADSATITITDGYIDTDNSVSELYITIPAGSTGVTIYVNMPYSTVYINGTEVDNIETWASANTTIIGADSTITGTLTVNKGNVEIYGSVNAVAFADTDDGDASIIKVWTVYDATQLAAAINLGARVEKIVLGADLALDSAITVSTALTIDGAGKTMTMTDTYNIQVSANLTIDDLTIDATNKTDTSDATGAILIKSSNVTLSISNSTIKQAGSGSSIAGCGNGAIAVTRKAALENVDIKLTDSRIELSGATASHQAGVMLMSTVDYECSNFTLEIDNTDIIATQADPTDPSTSTYMQYISAVTIGNINGLECYIKDSEFGVMGYPFYLSNVYVGYGSPNNMTLTLDNSKVTGWCAMNLRCSNSTINIINGSKLTGRNYNSGSSDGYSVIIMSGYAGSKPAAPFNSQVTGTTINIVDSHILAESYGNAGAYILHERNVYNEDNNVINFRGSTVLESNNLGGDAGDPFYMKYSPLDEITIEGVTKDGENNLTVNRDASVVLKTNMDGMRFSEGLVVGDGTASNPYQIFDNGDLSIIKYYSTGDYSACFKQMADIEYEYTPYVIGKTPAYGAPTVTTSVDDDSDATYSVSGIETTYAVACNLNGTYDGNGFAINNFRYDDSVLGSDTADQLVGLFNTVKTYSTIKNLSLTTDRSVGITITESNKNPSAMKVGSFAGKLEGTITGCSSEIPINVYGTDASFTGVGGITGWVASGVTTEITNCTYSGNLTVTNAGIGAGIAAYCSYSSGLIEYNTISGNITAPTAYGCCESSYDDGNNTVTGNVSTGN